MGIFQILSNDEITRFIFFPISALIALTLHELAHAYVAYRLGDNTAKNMGRLTLNPIKHIDPIGLIMFVVVGFGWAKAVPVNYLNFENPKRGMAITAFAGPMTNLIIAFVAVFIHVVTYVFNAPFLMQMFFSGLAQINAVLVVLNMLPIPPLDGSKILNALLDDRTYDKILRYERFGMILLMILLFTGQLTGVLFTARNAILELFYRICLLPFS